MQIEGMMIICKCILIYLERKGKKRITRDLVTYIVFQIHQMYEIFKYVDRKRILTNLLLSNQDFDMEGKYHEKSVYDIVNKRCVNFNRILVF